MFPTDGEIVACPVCEATYKAINKNGKIKLEAFIHEDDDLGELWYSIYHTNRV